MIKATPIPPLSEDTRGYTAEFENTRTGKHLIVFRKAGSVSGRHYHKGGSATKNPEILLLLNGTCTFNSKHIDDTEITTAEYTGPVRFEIPPYIWHELIPVTDCTFLEQNSVEEHASDTYRLD
ncbi:MAG: hypothetical protein H6551_11610 [Chitinophagales bacterium]|nr:hypothetical protein [Chitinophagaceae bacterium]MCB9065774.1 hypothetical protein [Chitinophagales bacterium]